MEVRAVSRKFKEAFSLFRACHDLYSLLRKMTTDEIEELGTMISHVGTNRDFVFYKSSGPTLSVILSGFIP